MEKMNPEVKAAWVSALRSGEYKQGKFGLKADDTYCCLGVLCDISDRGQWNSDGEYRVNGYESNSSFLPGDIRKWAGLSSPDPSVLTAGGYVNQLSVMNDKGTSFQEIADLIEQNF